MKGTSAKQFGLIVAYILPGFIALAGLAPLFPTLAEWLRPIDRGDLGLAPPLYTVLAAVTVGHVINCFRWFVIDRIHDWTGVKRPVWDDSRLDEVLGAYDYLVQIHYRYYELYANTLVAAVVAYTVHRVLATAPILNVFTDVGLVVLTVVLFAASRVDS